MLENKALWVLRAMAKAPEEVELVEFFPYRTGMLGSYTRHDDTCVIVDYSVSEVHYGGRLDASLRFSDKINRMENVVLKGKRDNHVCATVRFRGRTHALRFSDWGCTLVLDSKALKNPRPY